jgi:hypothetical protein
MLMENSCTTSNLTFNEPFSVDVLYARVESWKDIYSLLRTHGRQTR